MVLKSTSLEENRDNAMAVMMNLYKQHYKLWNYQISRVLTSSNNDINDLIHDVFVRLMATHVEKSALYQSRYRLRIFLKQCGMLH